jgi:hypothetical protein
MFICHQVTSRLVGPLKLIYSSDVLFLPEMPAPVTPPVILPLFSLAMRPAHLHCGSAAEHNSDTGETNWAGK